MKNLYKILEILGKWKLSYLVSAVLLTVSIAIRMLEPKVLQLAVDGVIVRLVTGSGLQTDYFSSLLASLLPGLNPENVYLVLIYLAAMFLVISLSRAAFMFMSSAITASSTESAIRELRDRLFSHIQHLPLAYFNKTPAGELIQRCTGDVETVRKFASLQLVEMLRMVALFIGAFVMMALIDFTYALIAIAVVPVIAFGSVYFFKKEGDVWTEHEKRQDRLTALTQENLSGIRVVKAFAKEEFEIEKFTGQNLEKRNWGLKLMRLHSFYWPLSDVAVHLQIAISVFFGGYFVLTNGISVGEYIAFYSYAVLVTWPLRRLGQLVSDMGMTSVALQRIYSILSHPVETIHESPQDSSVDAIHESPNGRPMIKGRIEFNNVFFKYDSNGSANVLNGISFEVCPGEKVALMGPAGAGKSTLVSLLMRFYDASAGTIKLDGLDIMDYSKDFLRDRIGVVLQKPFLFSTTLKDNIAYSDPGTRLDEVIYSARIAHIHDIIEESFPDGYNTLVGEKGVTLSGGQKQRVALARTLLKDPDILILDDSTSSVDTETEFGIRRAMQDIMKNKTVLIIAHRITSVEDCDRIIILNRGKVIEQGTHDELLRLNGFYKKIHDIQLSIEHELEIVSGAEKTF